MLLLYLCPHIRNRVGDHVYQRTASWQLFSQCGSLISTTEGHYGTFCRSLVAAKKEKKAEALLGMCVSSLGQFTLVYDIRLSIRTASSNWYSDIYHNTAYWAFNVHSKLFCVLLPLHVFTAIMGLLALFLVPRPVAMVIIIPVKKKKASFSLPLQGRFVVSDWEWFGSFHPVQPQPTDRCQFVLMWDQDGYLFQCLWSDFCLTFTTGAPQSGHEIKHICFPLYFVTLMANLLPRFWCV